MNKKLIKNRFFYWGPLGPHKKTDFYIWGPWAPIKNRFFISGAPGAPRYFLGALGRMNNGEHKLQANGRL